MMIPFCSPRNLTEEMVNSAMTRQVNQYSKDAFGKWIQLCDAKEVLKILLQLGIPYSSGIQIFCMAAQMGFDLHAEFGDELRASIGLARAE